VIAVAAWVLAAAAAACFPAQEPDPYAFRDGLVISCGATPPRNSFVLDPVAVAMALGTFRAPAAGDSVSFPDGLRVWEKVEAGADGALAHDALRNGYAFFQIVSPKDEVRILDARSQSIVYVNGMLCPGDWYETGYVRVPVPLKKGTNQFLFMGRRGRLQARLLAVRSDASFDSGDMTTPDAVVGESLDAWCAVPVLNATGGAASALEIEATCGDSSVSTPCGPIAPFATRKCGFRVRSAATKDPGELAVTLKLIDRSRGGAPLDRLEFKLRIRDAGATRKITFVSRIDRSVQYYCVNPAKPTPGAGAPGLVLSLHGAGVEATGQCDSYSRKENMHIVCPTNRRPFGFDWEDWGRLDALEVLDLASGSLHIDSAKVWLTGHSMGGHGTWQLGALFPGRFAAIAPSAGWLSFMTYAGMAQAPTSSVAEMLKRAALSSDTGLLLENYKQLGIYILHGDADDNVPVTEARRMKELLSKGHADFQYHEQKGAGHWWGSECVDWPPLFELFRHRSLPKEPPAEVAFVTPSPGISPTHHWIEVRRQIRCGLPSRVSFRADAEKGRIEGTTDNVDGLVLSRASGVSAPFELSIDGAKLNIAEWPSGRAGIAIERDGDRWRVAAMDAILRKTPARNGPFKQVFTNGFVFVYGTRGNEEENAWALGKARYDAEVFWVRGNGSVPVIPDTAFDAERYKDRNIILYGNADTHGAWKTLLPSSPVLVNRTGISVGGKRYEGGDLGCVFVYPDRQSESALLGVVAGTGTAGSRLLDRLSYFVSGVGFPDLCILGPSAPSGQEKEFTILGVGFFGNDWSVDRGEFVWER
jgi:dienelactone hydrolase